MLRNAQPPHKAKLSHCQNAMAASKHIIAAGNGIIAYLPSRLTKSKRAFDKLHKWWFIVAAIFVLPQKLRAPLLPGRGRPLRRNL